VAPLTRTRRRGLFALLALALAYAMVMQASGWAQTSHYGLVRAMGDGTAKIDRWHWETKDKAWVDGHFYSVKAPGLAVTALPFYKALEAAGAPGASRDVALAARETTALGGRWWRRYLVPANAGYDYDRAIAVKRQVEFSTPMVWALTVATVVLPALIMLLIVRMLGNRVAPGYGAIAGFTLGACTMVLPFSTLFFSHVPAAMLGLAAFAVLWREREGPRRMWSMAAAGALAGLAVTFEYPLALAGAILGLYAISRGPVVRRGLAYAGGVAAGVAPLLAYSWWAFGSPLHSTYENAVKEQGVSGHQVLGLNDDGFFGIGVPDLRAGIDLLLAPRGLLVLTPVVLMGVVGLVLMHRGGRRAEALTIGAVALGYLLYNAGYWLPFGGGSAGPRFLIPVLPFLAVPLALAWRRYPLPTIALAVPSALMMVAATLGHPMIGDDNIGFWVEIARFENFQHTVVTALGGGNGWAAVAPFAGLIAAGALLAWSSMPHEPVAARQRWFALGTLVGWTGLAYLAPAALGHDSALTNEDTRTLILAAAGTTLVVLMLTQLTRLRPSGGWMPAGSRRPGLPSQSRA
jgi:hypothetical protein